MKSTSWRTYVIWIVIAEVVGILSSLLSREGMVAFQTAVQQPPLSPPSILFPIVWTILYALMGISAARIYNAPPTKDRSTGLNLYIAQLIVNFFWSPIFFNAGVYGFAFLWLVLLWGLVFWMIISFRKTDLLAAKMQIPYLIWLTFAAYLNFGVWYLN